MKKWFLLTLLLCVQPACATSYFMAPAGSGGSDANNGTSVGTPWLTPNHAVNCGDTITAAAGAYASSSFAATFGTSTCAGNNNVAWVICATAFACTITATTTQNGIFVNNSFWGVQGFVVTATAGGNDVAACYVAYPGGGVQIHHIIFANNIANQCSQNGVESANNGTASVDYFAILGNIVYHSAQSNVGCFSGISIYQPQTSDLTSGTHIYIAGNFVNDVQVTGTTCNGGAPSDLNGISIDDGDGTQTGGLVPYAAQIVITNNISVYNGGPGVNIGVTTSAPSYWKNNTLYGNKQSPNQLTGTYCGEFSVVASDHIQASLNISAPTITTACNGNPLYAFYMGNNPTTGSKVFSNDLYSASGQFSSSDTGFSFGPNNINTNPSFANPTDPGAPPSCSGFATTTSCEATLISNFKPTAAVIGYGYQQPGTASVVDPLYPQWLCTVTNLPLGLITPGCASGTGLTPGAVILQGVTVR